MHRMRWSDAGLADRLEFAAIGDHETALAP